MYLPLAKFSPETDSAQAGTIVSMIGYIPTVKGWAGMPAPVATSLNLGAECRGAETVTDLSGTAHSFLGTQTKLYKATGNTLEDVSKAGDYTGSSSSRWCFTIQGNVVIATNKVDDTQSYVIGTSTDFANLAGTPPKAAICEAVGNFVFLFNYNDGTDTPDGYATCAQGDYTDWTPDIDTGAVRGRLYDTPGEVIGGKRLADYIVVYKAKSMYLGRFVGTPQWWQFSLISDIVGAVSQDSIATVGAVHYFMGDDNFWLFDSTVPRPIGDEIREWFNGQINHAAKHLVFSNVDLSKGIVYWYYPKTNSTSCDAWVAYNYRVDKWGYGLMNAQAALNYVSSGRTYAELETLYPTYADFDGLSYDAIEQPNNTPIPSIVNSSNLIASLNGESGTNELTIWDYGMDGAMTFVDRVRPRYVRSPTSAKLTYRYRDNFGENTTIGNEITETSGKFDFLWSARWHSFTHQTTGDVEISGYDINARQDSPE